MSMAFTKVKDDAWETLQLNAGILVDSFIPSTGTFGNILGATQGGINFNSNPNYVDFGEDVDNAKANTKQLKKLLSYDPAMSGTFLTCTAAFIASLLGGASVDGVDATKVVPREVLLDSDFTDLWWIGDYSDINTGASAGFLAIHLINALNTTGFQIQSSKDSKGTMSFEYHAHYDLTNEDDVPFEIYCKAGTTTGGIPEIRLSQHVITVPDEETYQLIATLKNCTSTTVTWTSKSTAKATVSNTGLVTAKDAGSTVITASVTEDGVEYTDTCTVIIPA